MGNRLAERIAMSHDPCFLQAMHAMPPVAFPKLSGHFSITCDDRLATVRSISSPSILHFTDVIFSDRLDRRCKATLVDWCTKLSSRFEAWFWVLLDGFLQSIENCSNIKMLLMRVRRSWGFFVSYLPNMRKVPVSIKAGNVFCQRGDWGQHLCATDVGWTLLCRKVIARPVNFEYIIINRRNYAILWQHF